MSDSGRDFGLCESRWARADPRRHVVTRLGPGCAKATW
jgi:hypothetical protein